MRGSAVGRTNHVLGAVSGRVSSAVDRATTVMYWLSAAVLLGIMLLGASDVLMRNVFGQPIRGTVAFVEIGLVALVYCALASVQRMDGHIAVDLVVSRLPGRARRYVERVADSVVLIGSVVLSWASTSAAIDATERGERFTGLVNIPSWPARILVAVGFTLLALQLLFQLGKRLTRGEEA